MSNLLDAGAKKLRLGQLPPLGESPHGPAGSQPGLAQQVHLR